jgi:F-type H+-transporting ATPase subunit gamma
MANTKDIQRRIKSIGNTKKITRAMEMVAASKMRKAVDAALSTRSYANLSWETLLNVTRGVAASAHPLLETRTAIKRQAIIVITSNRGLCGGFNAALLSLVRASIAATDIPTELILVGKKGESLAGTHQVVAQFPYPEAGLDAAAVLPIISFASESFLSGNYDRVYVAYTDFINAAKQNAKIRQLLPIKSSGSEEGLGIMGTNEQIGSNESFIQSKADKHSHREKYSFEYLFEPAPDKVLQAVVPRLLEIQLYQALQGSR